LRSIRSSDPAMRKSSINCDPREPARSDQRPERKPALKSS
jgi:hypothetical protein